jgi:hypothetical protein
MRFKPGLRAEPFNDTGRKRAACARSQRREREALPLLAPLIAEQQPTIDEVMAKRAVEWVVDQKKYRAGRAERWLTARARLDGYQPAIRRKLLSYWQTCQWPGDPSYFLSMLHLFDSNRCGHPTV